jgi:hypothetical protein
MTSSNNKKNSKSEYEKFLYGRYGERGWSMKREGKDRCRASLMRVQKIILFYLSAVKGPDDSLPEGVSG